MVNSAVSRYINELEQYLGCKLLHRTTRTMSLTPEGEHYLQRLSNITASIDELDSDITQRRSHISGNLKITAPEHVTRLFDLQSRLSHFLRDYPDVCLSWLSVNRYVDLVEEGVDLAIRVGELPDSGMIARPLGSMHVYRVASPEYLNLYGMPDSIEDLQQHRCILDSSNRQPARWAYRSANGTRHITVPNTVAANNGDLVAGFAAEGLGIAYLPDFLVRDYLDEGRLVTILRQYEIDPVPVSLYYPANRMMSQALRTLIDHLLA